MLIFVVYFFSERMGNVCFQYRQASGLWWEDRLRPLVDGAVNLTLNYILVQVIGVAGVMLSTILCQIFIDSLWASRILFRHYFTGQSQKRYLLRQALYAGVTILACAASMLLCRFLPQSGSTRLMSLLWMAIRGLICASVSAGVFLAIYRLLPEYANARRLVMKLLKRK